MSREIKFRAWHKKYKEMYEVTCIDWEAEFVWVKYYDDDREEWFSREEHFADLELMQYTGLKDKNGVDIYEGYVLKTFSNINKYTDSFAEDIEPKFEYTTIVRDGACFKTTYKKRPSYVLNENGGSKVKNMEVVGNIYENKNLLEEK